VRLSHTVARTSVAFDDPSLVSHAGLVPVMAGTLFAGVRAPSTLGSFLCSFTWGNVRQAEKTSREFLGRLSRQAPLLPGADVLAFVDTGSTQKRVYGHEKQVAWVRPYQDPGEIAAGPRPRAAAPSGL
jgi:hypothetical protein